MNKHSGIFWGVLLILGGIGFLLVQVDLISLNGAMIPAAIMLLLGILFHINFMVSGFKNPGVLVPGGILLIYSIFFIFLYIDNSYSEVLWPLFIIGPAFGLLELKVFSGGSQGSWIPVIILFEVGGIMFFQSFTGKSIFPIAIAVTLITVGLVMLINALGKNKSQTYVHKKPNVDFNFEFSTKDDDDK